ncbi:response regulator receiver protein [Calothrix brevissima NIES-22]|nr:response regulator receiver protein [Calothrix brevissima NIES-22]
MNSIEITELSKLLNGLNRFTLIQYNGRLNFSDSSGIKWSLYYRLGQIVWATGGSHPHQRLRRYLTQKCPQIDINTIVLNHENLSKEHWDYCLLEGLSNKHQIKTTQFNAIAESIITEVLFDMAQRVNSEALSCDFDQDVILDAPMNSTSGQMYLKHMVDAWNNWKNVSLDKISPNLSPVLRRQKELQEQVSSFAYNYFVNVLNGKYTFWDLAGKMNQNVLPVTRSLLPYINQGIIELVEIKDIQFPVTQPKSNAASAPTNTANTPLVICIDDSAQICAMLEQILTAQGLRFIGIQEPVQALPILIQKKPDLIFLDLIMPTVSGYEIYAQLRRSSFLSKIPVVILTGSDRLLEPVLSKGFGATEFMTKPVIPAQVKEIVNKLIGSKIAATVNQGHQSSNLAVCSL